MLSTTVQASPDCCLSNLMVKADKHGSILSTAAFMEVLEDNGDMQVCVGSPTLSCCWGRRCCSGAASACEAGWTLPAALPSRGAAAGMLAALSALSPPVLASTCVQLLNCTPCRNLAAPLA